MDECLPWNNTIHFLLSAFRMVLEAGAGAASPHSEYGMEIYKSRQEDENLFIQNHFHHLNVYGKGCEAKINRFRNYVPKRIMDGAIGWGNGCHT